MALNSINISILSTNHFNCKELEKMITFTLNDINVNANIEIIDDVEKIKLFGVTQMPSIAINNKVVFIGEMPSPKELKDVIVKYCEINAKKPLIYCHQEQIAIFCKALSDPINITIIEKIRNMKSYCANTENLNDLQLKYSDIIEHLIVLKNAGLLIGNIKPPMKFCVNKINFGIARILFTNLFK